MSAADLSPAGAAAVRLALQSAEWKTSIYADIRAERERAHAKHGAHSMESSPWTDPIGRRYRILVEEVGEVGKEFNDAEVEGRPVDAAALRKELIQVAAMAAAWADAIGGAA